MTQITVENTVEQLKKLFNRVNDVFYSEEVIQKLLANTEAKMLALPVGSDGVSFDAGDPDISKYKLTNGTIWTAIADAGDADITFQVPSIHEDVASILQNQVTANQASVTFDGKTYKGYGYDFSPKKLTGAMMLRSQDKQTIIILPNIEAFATPKLDDTGKPLYYNLSVTPLNNEEGVGIYYMVIDEAGEKE